MKVLFDSLGFWERCGGVSRYLSELVRRLKCIEVAVEETENDYLLEFGVKPARRSLRSFWPWWRWRGRGVLWRFVRPWGGLDIVEKNRRLFRARLKAGDFDLLHLTGAHDYGTDWRAVVGEKPIVVTVHDLIPEVVNGDEHIRQVRAEVLSVATLVICVSEATKREVIREYGVPEAKLRVVRHGVSLLGQGLAEPPARGEAGDAGGRGESDYLLYVGKREGYKNWAWMVREMAPILKERGWRLICTGAAFMRGEKSLLRQLGLADCCEARHVSDDELKALYRRALAFVYPSRDEGFGLPILEAMAEGCPVVASDIAPFREVAGKAADFFRLDDGNDLRQKLRAVRRNGRGLERVKAFSWERTARETQAVYDEAMRLWGAIRIAVLMTCHNRVETTRRALRSLMAHAVMSDLTMKVFLVDDGSTDGTGEMAREMGCEVISADGSLFWCKGMRKAWETAGGGWSHYLWLNDDVTLSPGAVAGLLALSRPDTVVSGKVGDYALKCDGRGIPVYMPGNFVLVPRAVYAKVGMISGAYSHGYGDWDYAVRCAKAGVKVVGTKGSLGDCREEPEKRASPDSRWRFLWHPKGAALGDAIRFSFVRGGWPRAVASAVHIVWKVLWRIQ